MQTAMVERMADEDARTSFGCFIFAWARMNFFGHFTVKKAKLPLPALRLFCLYIQWVAYKYAICEEGFSKNCLRTEISCVPRGIKRFGKLLNVNFVRKKIDYPREHYAGFPSVTRECRYVLGKLKKNI